MKEETDSASTKTLDPLAEPTTRVGTRFIVLLALANLGIWTAFFMPLTFLLPFQVQAIDEASKETNLALVTTVGAIISLVVTPVAGALSDRTTGKWGRRKTWVLWATVAAVGVLLIVGNLDVVGALAFGWAMAQLALNSSYAAVTAMLPDQVPVEQRGTVSAMVGIAQPLGILFGGVLVQLIPATGIEPGSDDPGGQELRYIACAVVLGITAILFLLGTSDPRLKKGRVPSVSAVEFIKAFWVSPREHPDFAWVWITRFLVMLGLAFVTTYLLFFTQDVLGYAPQDAEGAVFQIQVVLFLTLLVSAVVTGPLSDRVGKVRIFVIGAGAILGTAMVLLMFTRSIGMAMGVAFVMGIGFGAYTAVDLVLITRVLPNAEDRARDMGVVNIANALPQVMAPAAAGLIIASLKSNGFDTAYMVLYGLAAVVTVVGALLVTRIKSVP